MKVRPEAAATHGEVKNDRTSEAEPLVTLRFLAAYLNVDFPAAGKIGSSLHWYPDDIDTWWRAIREVS